MKLLVLRWRLLLCTLIVIVSAVSLASPATISPWALMAPGAPIASVSCTGWRKLSDFLARLNVPGEVCLNVRPCQHLLARLLVIVVITRPWVGCAVTIFVRGWSFIASMEWAWLITVVDLGSLVASWSMVISLAPSSLLAVALVVSISSTSAAMLELLLGFDDIEPIVGVKSDCHSLPRHGGSIMRPVTIHLE